MAALAVSHRQQPSTALAAEGATGKILLAGDGFKMRWVHTTSSAAPMIKIEPTRRVAHECPERYTMRQAHPPSVTHVSVAVAHHVGRPDPTAAVGLG